jgi:hypothetical protein
VRLAVYLTRYSIGRKKSTRDTNQRVAAKEYTPVMMTIIKSIIIGKIN